MQILKGHASGKPIYALSFSRDGKHLASSAQDETIRLWDLFTGRGQIVNRSDSWIVDFDPTNTRLLFNDSFPHGHVILNLDGDARTPLQPATYGTAIFSHDGKTVIVSEGNAIHFHDAASGNRLRSDPLTAVSRFLVSKVSQDGRLIAGCGWLNGSQQGNGYPAIVLEFPSGLEVARFNDATSYNNDLAIAADGRFLAGTASTYLRVWEVESRRLVFQDQPNKKRICHGVAFSPDGRWMASTHYDHSVRLYSTSDWSVQRTWDWGIGPTTAVTFAPDGLRVAAGGKKGKIVIWDIDP